MRVTSKVALLTAVVLTVGAASTSAQAVSDPPNTIGCNPVCEGENPISQPPTSPGVDMSTAEEANPDAAADSQDLSPGETSDVKQLDVPDGKTAADYGLPEIVNEIDGLGDTSDTSADAKPENTTNRTSVIDQLFRGGPAMASTATSKTSGAETASSTEEAAAEAAADAADAAADAASCGCPTPDNSAQIKGAMIQMGIKYFRIKNFKARLGKQLGQMTYDLFKLITKPGARQIKRSKRVPYPNIKARSAVRYAKSLYHVYEIFMKQRGPEYANYTWKYGITRQLDPDTRPQRQIPTCNKKYAGQPWFWECDWVWRYRNVVGWFAARVLEANLTVVYVQRYGAFPPGMPHGV